MLILILISIIVAVSLVIFYKMRHSSGNIPDITKRVYAITNKITHPSGLTFWLEEGVSLSNVEQETIKDGIEKCFHKSVRHGYTNELLLNEYRVAIVKGIKAPESGLPCYKVPAGSYRGTEWDLGGYILAAGQVIDIKNNLIVLPEHKGEQLDNLKLISEYETEHIILYNNNRTLYEETKVHKSGAGHPIIT